jgi:Tfp pilus assembly protein PilF
MHGRRINRSLCCASVGVCLLLMLSGCRLMNESIDQTIANDLAQQETLAHQLVERGNHYIKKNQFEKAATHFRQAIEADPDNGIAHNNMGLVHYYLHDFLNAAVEFEIAIDKMPNDPAPMNNLGLVLEMAARPDEAIDLYYQASQLAPTNPEYLGNLARAKVRMKQFDSDLENQLHALLLFERRLPWQDWAREQLALYRNPFHDRGPPSPTGDPLGGLDSKSSKDESRSIDISDPSKLKDSTSSSKSQLQMPSVPIEQIRPREAVPSPVPVPIPDRLPNQLPNSLLENIDNDLSLERLD